MTLGTPLARGCFQRLWYAPPGRVVPSDGRRLEHAMGRHLELVWRVLRRLGLSPQDADETAQDVFWVLARRLSDVPDRAEKSFLVSTAIRMASDQRRKLATHAAEDLPEEIPSNEPAPDELVALRHARVLLDEALDTLSPDQRAVFVLIEMEEMTAPEVAEVLEIPLGTVASRLHTARRLFDAAIRRMRLREVRSEA